MRVFNLRAYGRCLGDFILWLRRRLVWRLTQREISERYVGQMLGGVWAVLHPVIMLAVYFFLFSVVFKIRLPDQGGFPTDYFLYILSGLAPWLAFAEAANRGATAITSQSALVKQVVFPLEILPVKVALTSFMPFAIMGTLLLLYKAGLGLPLWPGLLLLPLALALQITLTIGLVCLTSAAGVYLRDLKDLIQAFMLIIIYLLPLFYAPDMVPGSFRPILVFNPLSHLVWCWQDVFFYNGPAHPWSWAVLAAGSLLIAAIGTRAFNFLKVYFGNLL